MQQLVFTKVEDPLDAQSASSKMCKSKVPVSFIYHFQKTCLPCGFMNIAFGHSTLLRGPKVDSNWAEKANRNLEHVLLDIIFSLERALTIRLAILIYQSD